MPHLFGCFGLCLLIFFVNLCLCRIDCVRLGYFIDIFRICQKKLEILWQYLCTLLNMLVMLCSEGNLFCVLICNLLTLSYRSQICCYMQFTSSVECYARYRCPLGVDISDELRQCHITLQRVKIL